MSSPHASEYELNIQGQKTYISIISYTDRYFVTISQLDTFGTMIQANADITPDGTLAYTIRTLIGKRDEDILTLCARRLIDRIYNSIPSNTTNTNQQNTTTSSSSIPISKSLILGIGLKPEYETLDTIRIIINALDTLDHIWGPTRILQQNTINNNNFHDDDDNISTSIPLSFPKLTTIPSNDNQMPIPIINDTIGTVAAVAAAERAAKIFIMGSDNNNYNNDTLDKELMEMSIQ